MPRRQLGMVFVIEQNGIDGGLRPWHASESSHSVKISVASSRSKKRRIRADRCARLTVRAAVKRALNKTLVLSVSLHPW